MLLNVSYLFIYFIIFSFIGWLYEVILSICKYHHFVNRGFLIGPYCPIYGSGGILITKLLEDYASNPIVLFILAMFICMVLEYITSFLMEKLFKARWWDYSNQKFNVNGRICLLTTVVFGLGGLLTMYIINPFIYSILKPISSNVIEILGISLIVIFLVDNVISFSVISKIKKADIKPYKDNTDEITRKIKEYLYSHSILTRRLSSAFPNFKSTIERTKNKVDELKKKSKQLKKEMLIELKRKQKEIKKEIKKIKKEKRNK